MPVHASDIHLFGFHWQQQFYLDKYLLMGCSISCVLFEQFLLALQHALLTKFSVLAVSHILEVFIVISPAGSDLCQQQLQNFLSIVKYIGFPIKESNTIPPSTCVPIHGILVISLLMEAQLPDDKSTHLFDLVESFSRKRMARLKLRHSLLGHLSFA